nr:MAG TPA: hypothetical protein [Caudoviricetes sp.]
MTDNLLFFDFISNSRYLKHVTVFSNVCLPSVPTMPNSTLKLQPTQKNHMHYKNQR